MNFLSSEKIDPDGIVIQLIIMLLVTTSVFWQKAAGVVNADRSSKFFLIASVVYLIGVVVSLLGLVKVALG